MKLRRAKQWVGFGVAVMVMVGFGGLPSASAAVECGAIIKKKAKLTKSLDCSGFSPALRVIGPKGSLDMAGFTVDCENPDVFDEDDGIVVEGEGASLINGTVKRCFDGVVASGKGYHAIIRVTSTYNFEDGFQVEKGSNGNTFVQNNANKNGDPDKSTEDGDGFNIDSHKNQFVQNNANDNIGDGFDVDGGNRNHFKNNSAKRNKSDGYDVDQENEEGGEKNIFEYNLAQEAHNDGFDIDGNRNYFEGNRAIKNGVDPDDPESTGDGFDIDSDYNELKENEAIKNTDNGFEIEETGNFLVRNLAKKNQGLGNGDQVKGGIVLQGPNSDNPATKTRVIGNTATQNKEFDLVDENPGCGTNTWLQNTGTRNMTCIR